MFTQMQKQNMNYGLKIKSGSFVAQQPYLPAGIPEHPSLQTHTTPTLP